MKKFFFLMLFGLFEMGYATNPSPRNPFDVIRGACEWALWNFMRPISPLAKLKSDIANKFAQYGHKVGYIRNSHKIDDNVYRKGLANLALALERGTPLTLHSRVITDVVIWAKGRGVDVWDSASGGLKVYISAHTAVEEIVPNMNVALLEHEIKQKVHVYGPTLFKFLKVSDVDDEKLASFLKTFIKALEDDKDAARIADFPDLLHLKIIDQKVLDANFMSAVNGFDIVVSADAPAESLFHRLANALLEERVTDWMRENYAYLVRNMGIAVINNGVDNTAYERGLKRILEWFDDPSLVRDTEHLLVRLGHIYVTENQLEIKPRQVSNSETVFDIYIPSNGAEMNTKIFTKLLPPAQ